MYVAGRELLTFENKGLFSLSFNAVVFSGVGIRSTAQVDLGAVTQAWVLPEFFSHSGSSHPMQPVCVGFGES